MKKLNLYSPFPLATIQTYFEASVKYHCMGTALESEDAFLGRMKGNRFFIYFKRADVRNSFTVYLRGEIIELPEGGCTVTCRFIQPGLTFFCLVILTGCVILSLSMLFSHSVSFPDALYPLLFGTAFSAYLYFLPTISAYSKNRLLKKLKEIIEPLGPKYHFVESNSH